MAKLPSIMIPGAGPLQGPDLSRLQHAFMARSRRDVTSPKSEIGPISGRAVLLNIFGVQQSQEETV